ncbi:MAG: hypothetical protein IJE43_19560 [Alphaproteobacteria bacterium]|nr:hypothetical protein [Alphaproteobacteria bacterium]
MKNLMIVRDNIIGFGISQEDMEFDWQVNKYKKEDNLPLEHIRAKTYINPWFPTENMLHLKDIDCLRVDLPWFISQKTGNRVVINKYGRVIYYYLMNTVGLAIDYFQINVILGDAFNTLFKRVHNSFNNLEDYNSIFVGTKDYFNNYTVYVFEGYDVLVSKEYVGLRLHTTDLCYILNRQDDLQADICYLAYRAGVEFRR